jgi:hypothetical protein
MATSFTDETAPRHRGPLPPPRGLLPIPAEIQERVAQDQARLQPFYTDDYARLTLDDWTLAYYYEGETVAYRRTPQGVEVLAVGFPEIGDLLRPLTQAQVLDIIIKQP